MIYQTYTHSRRFGSYNIPIAVQSCFIRDYCKKSEIPFVLPRTEYCIKNCYSSLINMISEHNSTEKLVIIISSIYMLEEASNMNDDKQEILSNSNVIYNCVLENKSVNYQQAKDFLTECSIYNNIARNIETKNEMSFL